MIKVESDELARALGFLSQAYLKNSPADIYKHVKLSVTGDKLTMTQSNGTQEMVYSISCESTEDQSFTVEMGKFKERVSQYPKDKDVSITLGDNKKATLKCGRSKIVLNSLDANDYPDTEETTEFSDIVFNAEELKRAFNMTRNAQGNNDVRYYLNGTYLSLSGKKCDIVSTDGHRLHHCVFGVDSDVEGSCIIPREAIPSIYKYLDSGEVTIRLSANHLKVTDNESSIKTKLIDGKFPDWNRVIPKQNEGLASFTKQDLETAIKSAMITSNEKNKGVRFLFKGDSVIITSSAPDNTYSEEVVDCAITCLDSDLEIGVNGLYMLSAISCIESESILIKLKDSNSSMLIKEGNYQAVVMPMRL